MNLQLFVTDTEEWADRLIHIENVVKHTQEMGVHKVWVREDEKKISPSAQRFYVKDLNLEDHKGAAYVFLDEIVMSHKITEREVKLLTAGIDYANAFEDFPPHLLSPEDKLKDVITMKLRSKLLSSRAAGYLSAAVGNLGVITLEDLAKKASRRKLNTMEGVKEKTIQGIERLLSEAGLKLRD